MTPLDTTKNEWRDRRERDARQTQMKRKDATWHHPRALGCRRGAAQRDWLARVQGPRAGSKTETFVPGPRRRSTAKLRDQPTLSLRARKKGPSWACLPACRSTRGPTPTPLSVPDQPSRRARAARATLGQRGFPDGAERERAGGECQADGVRGGARARRKDARGRAQRSQPPRATPARTCPWIREK